MMNLLEDLFLTLVVIATTVSSCVSCVPSAAVNRLVVLTQPTDEIKLWPSVARVSTISTDPIENPGSYLATAWAIDDNHLMTAGHFCNSASDQVTLGKATKELNIDMVDSLGRPAIRTQGTIKAFINKNEKDMCIIESKNHGLVPLQIKQDLSGVETEDRIISFGAPRGKFPVKREGFVSAIADDGILVAVEIQSGNSGGPVLWQGQVIGIIVASFTDTNEYGIAVRAEALLEFIAEHIK